MMVDCANVDYLVNHQRSRRSLARVFFHFISNLQDHRIHGTSTRRKKNLRLPQRNNNVITLLSKELWEHRSTLEVIHMVPSTLTRNKCSTAMLMDVTTII